VAKNKEKTKNKREMAVIVENLIMGAKKKITNEDCGLDDAEFDCRR